ncbi:MAG: nucleotide exchange factor GrpE [Acidobacteriia bacterium]|nr:nucleotide exchange factor GrpE [Terriglobia bacterium]
MNTVSESLDMENERSPFLEDAAEEVPLPPAGPAELDAFHALSAEKAELEDLLKRRQADHENFRRRAERERAEVYEIASMETVRMMLPTVDDLERALQTIPEEEGPLREYAKGTHLIYQRLMETLTKLGLEPLETVGQHFDPNLHHAVQKEQRKDVDEETVLEEYQRGYNFKGRPLRPAMVKVSVKS